jgi:hypothetical protein
VLLRKQCNTPFFHRCVDDDEFAPLVSAERASKLNGNLQAHGTVLVGGALVLVNCSREFFLPKEAFLRYTPLTFYGVLSLTALLREVSMMANCATAKHTENNGRTKNAKFGYAFLLWYGRTSPSCDEALSIQKPPEKTCQPIK